jgi:hypothetical protein
MMQKYKFWVLLGIVWKSIIFAGWKQRKKS